MKANRVGLVVSVICLTSAANLLAQKAPATGANNTAPKGSVVIINRQANNSVTYVYSGTGPVRVATISVPVGNYVVQGKLTFRSFVNPDPSPQVQCSVVTTASPLDYYGPITHFDIAQANVGSGGVSTMPLIATLTATATTQVSIDCISPSMNAAVTFAVLTAQPVESVSPQ